MTVQPISTAEDVSGGTSRVASGGGSSGGGDGGAGAASGGGFKLSLEHHHVRTEWQVTRMKASDIMALQHPREDGQSGKVHELHRRLNEDLHMALGWKKRAEVEKAQWEAQLEKRRSAEVSNLLEQYLPPRLLCGLLPAALLERHDFYQDLTKPRIIRGYPCVPVSGECSTQVDCSTFSHCFPPLSRSLPLPSRCFSLPFAAFRCLPPLTASPCALLCQEEDADADDEDAEASQKRKEAAARYRQMPQQRSKYPHIIKIELKTLPAEHALCEASLGSRTFAHVVRKVPTGAMGEDMVLLSLLTAPEGSQLHSIACTLSSVEPLSHILAWTKRSRLRSVRWEDGTTDDMLDEVSAPSSVHAHLRPRQRWAGCRIPPLPSTATAIHCHCHPLPPHPLLRASGRR